MKGYTKPAKTKTLGIFSLLLGVSSVLFSWSLFFWMESILAIIVFIPVFLVLFVVVILLVIDWAWKISWLRRLKIRVNPRTKQIFIAGVILLTLAAPFYSYLYGTWLAAHVLEELGISASQQYQQITLLSFLGDLGEPRHVLTSYVLKEPMDTAIKKTRQRLTASDGWADTSVEESATLHEWLAFKCDTSSYFKNSINFYEENRLHILLHYNTEVACLLLN